MVSLTRSYGPGVRRAVLLSLAVAFPATFDPGTEDVFGVARFSLLMVATVVLVGLWAMEWLLVSRRPEWRNGLHWPVLALLGWLVVATAVSADPRTALFGEYREYAGLISAICFAVIFFAAAQAFRGGHVVSALRAIYFGGGGLVALYGLVQLHDRCFPGSRWDPIDWGAANLAQSALISTLGNPNHLSGFLAILIPIGVALFLLERSTWPRALIVGTAAIYLVEIVHAQSRGALLAMVIGVVVVCIAMWPELRARPVEAAVTVLSFAAALLVFPLLFGSAACPGTTVDLPARIRSATDTEGRTPTAERVELWRAALAIGADRPVFGGGPSSYRWYLGSYQSERLAKMDANVDYIDAPHNTFLVRLTDGGIPAVSAFVAILALAAAHVVRTWRRLKIAGSVRPRVALGGTAAGVSAWVVQATFNVEQLALSFAFWYLLGLVCALASDATMAAMSQRAPSQSAPTRLRRTKRGPAREPETKVHVWRIAGAAGTLALIGILSAAASAPHRADRSYHEGRVSQRSIPRAGPARAVALEQTNSRLASAIATHPWEPTYPANYASFVVTTPGPFASAEPRAVIAALREAKTLLTDAIALQPRNHLYQASLGAVLLKLHEFTPDPDIQTGGVAAIRRALEFQPWRAAPAIALAQALALTRVTPSAEEIAIVERAITHSPLNVELLRMAARLYDAFGGSARAKELWQRVLELAKDDAEARRALTGR